MSEHFVNQDPGVLADQQNRSLLKRQALAGFTAGIALITAGCGILDREVRTEDPTEAAIPAGRISGALKERGPVTDPELSAGGYNCGKGVEVYTADGRFDYGPQIDFLNKNPELVQENYDLLVTDREFGMGEEAWNVLLDQGQINRDTDKAKFLATNSPADADMGEFLKRVVRLEISQPRRLINFTCDGGIRPVEIITVGASQEKNALNGVVLTEDVYRVFASVAQNLDRFEIIPIEVEIDGEMTRAFFVATHADGCKNPVRVPVPELPEVPVITVTPPPFAPPVVTVTPPPAPRRLHAPQDGPPPAANQPPYPQAGTPGYRPGNAEIVVEQQESETPGGLDTTEHGTEAGGPGSSPGGGDQSVVNEPGSEAQDNPQHVPGSESQGTNQGTSNDANSPESQTEGTGQTSDPDSDQGMPG